MYDYNLIPITEEFKFFFVDKVKNARTKLFEVSNISLTKKEELTDLVSSNIWVNDWLVEFENPKKRVYRHVIKSNPVVLNGLLSFSRIDNKLVIYKCQLAPNFYNKEKPYYGVFENFLIHLCRDLTFGGDYILFNSTKEVISEYKKKFPLKAINGETIIITEICASKIITKTYKERRK